LCADRFGGATTADTGYIRNLSGSVGVNDCTDLHSLETRDLSHSHLRAFDSFVGPRIFYSLLADTLVSLAA
jgi:hypothetical protein